MAFLSTNTKAIVSSMQCSFSMFERINRQDKEKIEKTIYIYIKQETTTYYVPSSGGALKRLIIK